METANDCYIYAERMRNPVAQIRDSGGGDSYSDAVRLTVSFETSDIEGSGFIANTSNYSIKVSNSGWYKAYYQVKGAKVNLL